jgi:hypothetical protein
MKKSVCLCILMTGSAVGRMRSLSAGVLPHLFSAATVLGAQVTPT